MASSSGVKVFAKLSQRFLITKKDWLKKGAEDLLTSTLPLATQKCKGVSHFDLRTEACLINVEKWNTKEVLERIKPRRYWNDSPFGLNAESIIYRLLQDLLGGYFWPWDLFGEERHAKSEEVIWHTSNSEKDYKNLAGKHGVKLPEDFTVDGWQHELREGKYTYG